MEPVNGFLTKLLDSGVQVVGQPMEGVESVGIGILVGTGARDETREAFGISHFTDQMLFRGTEHFSARELSEKFDALGISYDASAGLEMTLVSAVLLGDKVAEAVDLLADVLRFPSFPDEDIEQVRALILQELKQREDQPGQKVMDSLRQKFFAGSPLGNDVLGTEETVSSISRSALREYWRDRFTSNNMIVSIAGKFDWDRLVEQLERVTASWFSGRGRMLLREPQPNTGIEVIERDLEQEHLGFAFPGVAYVDPHYYAGALFAQALGGSSNSRLFQEVREKRGLAYAVQARFDGLEKTGFFRIYAGTTAERAHESVRVIMDELAKAQADGITEEELQRSKIRLKSQLVMRSESTSSRMVSNLRSWWFEEELHTLEDVTQRIERVTVEEIQQLAQVLDISHKLGAVALGPRKEDELFGQVLARS
jgi:predicted Zn-dependent peptidase